MKVSALFSILALSNLLFSQNVWINEVMNNSGSSYERANYDWVELYNSDQNDINLKGWFLSDDPEKKKKWKFPSVNLAANSYLVVYLSGLDYKKKEVIHTNFKLSSKGEPLILTNNNGVTADSIHFLPCSNGFSFGRSTNGGQYFEQFLTPTKQSSNINSTGILFSHESDIYDYFFELELQSKSNDTIRYTEDGSIPGLQSKIYNGSIKINSRQDEKNLISHFAKGQGSSPETHQFKGSIVRAATFKNGKISSKVYTKTYFTYPHFLKKYEKFNIVSLISDANNLFQKDSGIYVNGGKDLHNANYNKRGKKWERRAYITFFDTHGTIIFSQDVRIRIHGQSTRKYASKSFRIYADKRYGSPKIYGNIFNESAPRLFDKLILKSTMGDLQKTIFKDECTSFICRNLHVDIPNYAPCILFINGEYWGIYNLREYLDTHYISEKYNLDKDSVNIIIHGAGNRYSPNNIYRKDDNTRISLFYDYTQSINFKDSSTFSIISDFFDVKSIIDYYAVQLFFGNSDYLNNNNKLWNYGKNGAWHQFLYDLDYCWMNSKLNTLSQLLNPKSSSRHPSYSTLLFRVLILNPIFRSQFIERINYLLNHDLSEDNLVKAIYLFKEQYTPVVKEHMRRWGRPGSFTQWEKKVSYLISFAKSRHTHFVKHLSLIK